MNEKFLGYRKKTKEEIEDLWNNAYFTFDTNSLLNLYRYSEISRNDTLDLIKKVANRTFITKQVAFEFSKNRYETINEIIKKHSEFLKNLAKIKDEIIDNNHSLFLSSELELKFKLLIEEIDTEIINKTEIYNNLFQVDDVYNIINKLFKDNFLEGFDENQLKEIEKEGEFRYNKKIPPGFSDTKKEENKYGDLIIWKEIIDFARTNDKSVIFISDDSKDDWIWKLRDGKIIGPRPELIQEFFKETGKNFHIYRSDRFIEFGAKFLNETINSNTVHEITKVTEEVRLPDYFKYLKNLNQEELEDKFKYLTPRESDLLRLNIGVGNLHPLKLKEIAETFDLDLISALKIKNKALRKLISLENKN